MGIYLALVLAILPFVKLPGYFSPFEVPKSWWIILNGIIILIWHGLSRYPKGQSDKRILMTMWGLFVLMAVSSLANGSFWESLSGNPYRGDGLLLLLSMISAATVVGKRWTAQWQRLVFPTVFISSVILGGMGRTLGNNNLLAGYLVTTLPYGYYLITEAKGAVRWGWVLVFLYQIVIILETRSWGGLAGMVVIGLFALRKVIGTRLVAALTALALVMVTFLYQLDYEKKVVFGHIVAEERTRILTKGVLAVKERPLMGWGWAQFAKAFAEIDYPYPYLVDAYVDRPHSSILDYGVSGGMPGLILYLALIYLGMRRLKAKGGIEQEIFLTSAVVYLVVAQTNITSIATDLIFFLAIGAATGRAGKG